MNWYYEEVKRNTIAEQAHLYDVDKMKNIIHKECLKEGFKFDFFYTYLNLLASDGRYCHLSPSQRVVRLLKDWRNGAEMELDIMKKKKPKKPKY